MPVPFVVKATNIFEGDGVGWTESYLFQQTGNDLATAYDSANIIAQKRAALLGKECGIKAIRVSFESDDNGQPVVGDAFLQYSSYPGNQAQGSAEKDAALMMRLYGPGRLTKRFLFLRGIWDSIEDNEGAYDPGAAGAATWQGKLDSWVAAMLGRAVGWNHRIKSAAKAVLGYTSDPDSNLVTISCEVGTFGAGPYSKQMVRIAGVNGQSTLNGQVLVTPTADTICETVKPIAVVPYRFGGTIRTYTQSFVTAIAIDPQKIVTRRVGAPFGITWTCTGASKGLVHYNPCGKAVDIARRPYTTACRFFSDSGQEVFIRWYPALPSAGTLPFPSRIQSLDWSSHPWLAEGVGEVFGAIRPYNGAQPLAYAHDLEPCEPAEVFHQGEHFDPDKPPQLYNVDGFPLCCLGAFIGQGGLSFDGSADFTVTANDGLTCATAVEGVLDSWIEYTFPGAGVYFVRYPVGPVDLSQWDWNWDLVDDPVDGLNVSYTFVSFPCAMINGYGTGHSTATDSGTFIIPFFPPGKVDVGWLLINSNATPYSVRFKMKAH